MSRLPKVDKKPKNNRSTKFRWVDMQWEKLLTKQEEDKALILKLEMENAELKDKLIDAGEYAKTDGYEVGSPSDYKWDKQLNLDFEVNKISDNDFEVREQFNRECD